MPQRLFLASDSSRLRSLSTARPPPEPALLAAARSARSRSPSVSSPLLRHIIDSLAEGVVVANAEGRFLLFNPAAERILSQGLMDVPLAEWSSVYGCFRPDMATPFPADELPLARSLRGEVIDDCDIYIRRIGAPEGGWINGQLLYSNGGVK